MIRGDSTEYDLLEKWAKNFDCDGHYSCEIGVREGLGSKIIMDNVINNYMHIGIDPYGDRVYQHCDDQADRTWIGFEKGVAPTYPDTMRDTMLNDFREYRNQGKFRLANMTDKEFMSSPNHQDMTFAFVHFDGPHTSRDVMNEAIWFAERSAPHARFVFDDHNTYQMSIIAYALTLYGFKTHGMGDSKCMLAKVPEVKDNA